MSKKHNKSFADDLSLLFQEVIDEKVEEVAQKVKDGKPVKFTRRTKPDFGLDALFRQTLVENPEKPFKKRISFTFETEKIEKLKGIAKEEKARLRDIVGELIENYIKEHEKSSS